MSAEVLAHFSKVIKVCAVLLEVNVSFLVIFVCGMRDCWSMFRYTIPVMVVPIKKGPYTLSLLRAQNTFTVGLSRTFSRKTRGFSLPQILQLTTGGASDALPMEVTLNHNYPR
jgi:hypothetical protein